MQQTIRVGVFNWTRFMSSGGFYPADLPEDWRLSFYANEFESACISLSELNGKWAAFQEWLEDLETSFEWSLYIDDLRQLDFLESLLNEQLIPRWLIVSPQLYPTDVVSAWLNTQDPGIKHPQVIEAQKLWRPEYLQAESRIALLPGAQAMKSYRIWVEAWLRLRPAADQKKSLTLWLDASTSNYQTLSDCRVLVEMMGY